MRTSAVRGPLAAVAAGLLLAACGQATVTSGSASAPHGTWPSFSGPAFGGARVLALTTVKSGCVAVGVTGHPAATVPASWTSPDCRTWTHSPVPASPNDGPPPSLPSGATRSGLTTTTAGTLVAIGDDAIMADEQSSVVAAWTSSDGRSWSPVRDDADFGTLPSYVQGAPQGPATLRSMAAVAADGPGVMAVGSDSGKAATWTSTDLSTWTRTDLPAAASTPGSDEASSVLADQQVTVIGGARMETSANGTSTRTVPVVWVGTTPADLTPVLLPSTRTNVSVAAVTESNGTLVAAGTSADFYGSAPPRPTTWTSRDRGHTWSEAFLGGDGVIQSAVATPQGLVFAGTSTEAPGAPSKALVWVPGRAKPVSPGAGGVLATAETAQGVLLAGDDGIYARSPAPVWLLPAGR